MRRKKKKAASAFIASAALPVFVGFSEYHVPDLFEAQLAETSCFSCCGADSVRTALMRSGAVYVKRKIFMASSIADEAQRRNRRYRILYKSLVFYQVDAVSIVSDG